MEEEEERDCAVIRVRIHCTAHYPIGLLFVWLFGVVRHDDFALGF